MVLLEPEISIPALVVLTTIVYLTPDLLEQANFSGLQVHFPRWWEKKAKEEDILLPPLPKTDESKLPLKEVLREDLSLKHGYPLHHSRPIHSSPSKHSPLHEGIPVVSWETWLFRILVIFFLIPLLFFLWKKLIWPWILKPALQGWKWFFLFSFLLITLLFSKIKRMLGKGSRSQKKKVFFVDKNERN